MQEKNYSKSAHVESWNLEKKFFESYKDYLVWSNKDWDQVSQYDSKGKNLGDFTVNYTPIKIELQKFNFNYNKVLLYARRFFEVNNYLGTYGKFKDLSNTVLVISDGDTFGWLELSNDMDKGKLLTEFPGKRKDWEKAYEIPLDRFNHKDSFEQFLKSKIGIK